MTINEGVAGIGGSYSRSRSSWFEIHRRPHIDERIGRDMNESAARAIEIEGVEQDENHEDTGYQRSHEASPQNRQI